MWQGYVTVWCPSICLSQLLTILLQQHVASLPLCDRHTERSWNTLCFAKRCGLATTAGVEYGCQVMVVEGKELGIGLRPKWSRGHCCVVLWWNVSTACYSSHTSSNNTLSWRQLLSTHSSHCWLSVLRQRLLLLKVIVVSGIDVV